MKKLRRLLFRLIFLGLLIFTGIFSVNYISFPSKQISVDPVESVKVEDAVVKRLAGAIRIPTISKENYIDTSAFLDLDTFLWENYPLVDSLLEKTRVNKFSYLLRWPGQNAQLSPILLMAHLDVVPVENEGEGWEENPFSGKVRDGFLYGRGALDDKLSALGILEAVEMLLNVEWAPQRTVYVALGHDEEISGRNGAKAIAQMFADRDIELEFVLDEGGPILEKALPGCEPPVALVGLAEKGYATFDLTVNSKEGGHSSMPKEGSAINVLSEAIVRLQQNPPPAQIDGPVRDMFDHVGPEMNFFNKLLFANLDWTDGLVIGELEKKPGTNATIRTTAAPTILKSGFKDNVIPTQAKALVNCRIRPGESVESTMTYLQETVGEKVEVKLSNPDMASEPPPISDRGALGFSVIQKTVRQVYPESIVAPFLMVGTTDSRHFVGVSKNIYRFLPVQITHEQVGSIHGKNEKVGTEAYKNMVRWYRQLFLNACK